MKHTQRFNKERQTRNKVRNKISTQINGTTMDEK